MKISLTTIKDARPVQMYTPFRNFFLQGRVVLRSARLDDLGAAVVPRDQAYRENLR